MKNNEKPDILNRIKGIKLRRELTALLAFMVMLSTSYAMIHPGEALNNSTARSFMFFNEEDGVTEETAVPTEAPDMNALLDADRDSGAVEEVPAEETPAEEVQNEETAAVTEEAAFEPTSTPAETVVPTLAPTVTPENTAEATGTPETLESADPAVTAEAENTSDPFSTASTEPVIEETSTPEATASATPEVSASASPEATASAEPTATPEAEEEEYPAFSEENIVPLEEDGTETVENIRVFIKAAEGTFPEGTTVKVVLVRDTKVLEAIEQAAVEKAKEEDKDVKVNQVQAVDITFTDKDGNEIQPLKPIAVSFKSELVKEAENTTVVHVEQDENKEKITDTKTVDTIAKPEDSDLVDSIEDNEVVIEADSFSVYGIVGMTQNNTVVKGEDTVEIGETITLSGAGNKKHNWKSSNNTIATVNGSGVKATVTGVSEGTAVITHTYQGGSENFNITVVDPYTVSTTSDNLSVIVKENGNSRKLSGYTVVVEAIKNDNEYYEEYEAQVENDTAAETGLGFLDMYHIYLADQDGTEVDLENQNVNLKVTMTYRQIPSGWPSNKDINVGHYNYKKTADEKITKKSVNGVTVNGNSISFIINSFSTITVSAPASAPPGTGAYTYAYEEQSILSNASIRNRFGAANQWQIVSGEFVNNDSAHKTAYDYIRVQKNVIPTNTENEFYVYLSLDLNYFVIITELLQSNGLVQERNHAINNDGSSKHQDHCWQAWNNGTATTAQPLYGTDTGHEGYQEWHMEYHLPDGQVVKDTRYGPINTFENGWMSFLLGDTWYIVGEAHKGEANTFEVNITDEDIALLLENFVGTQIAEIVDTMGVTVDGQMVSMGYGITAEEIIATGINGQVTSPPQAEIVDENKGISWKPTASTLGSPASGWYNNIAELVYKIKYVPEVSNGLATDTTDVVQNSAAHIKTNEETSITYSTVDSDGHVIPDTKPITSPVIRGMLYEIKGIKKGSDTNEALKDAGFTLYSDAAYTLPVTEEIFTDASGAFDFPDLQYGTYYLRETTVPDGYSAVADMTIRLCYTDNAEDLIGQGAGKEALYADDGAAFELVDERNIIEVEKKVIIDKRVDPEFDEASVDQTIYIALWDADTNSYVMGSDGKILVKPITIVDGVVIGQGTSTNHVKFGVDEALPNHKYYVSELVKAEDINPADISRIPGYEDDDHVYVFDFGNLTFIGKDSQGNDAVFQVRTPIGHEWNYETKAYNEGSGRTADLSGANNEARVRFDNTYVPETTIEFVAQKQWGRRTIAADGTWGMAPLSDELLPENASVDITLYQSIDGVKWDEYATITLNGEADADGEDAVWRAVFKDLPKFDTDESSPTFSAPYRYRANETDKPDEFEPFDAVTDHVPMGQHGNDADDYILTGGIIYNIQKTTEITVKKVDDKKVFLPGASFKLLGPDINNHEALLKEFTVSSDGGFTIDNLVSGDYKLVEIAAPDGYIILTNTIEFSVNAIPASGENVITWKGGTVPENVSSDSPSTTTNTGDTITVVNTPGSPLPNTGGSGTLPYTLGGITVMLTALMYGFRMRRRERRLN